MPVNSLLPTPQDIRDLADAVEKTHGKGMLDQLRKMIDRNDTEWCMFFMLRALIDGAAPRITRDEWDKEMNREETTTGEETMSNEIVIRIEGLAELIAELRANTAAHCGHKATVPAEFAKAEQTVPAQAEPAAEPVPAKVRKPKVEKPVEAPKAVAEESLDAAPPAKPVTLEEVRAEGQATVARLKAALGEKFAPASFIAKFLDIGGEPRVAGQTRSATGAKPENYAAMIEFARNAKPEDYK